MGKRDFLFTRGTTPEERFLSVETSLRRIAGRVRERVVGIIPPTIISSYITKPEPDGSIFRTIIPAQGVIKGGCFSIDSYTGKNTVDFLLIAEGPSGVAGLTTITSRKRIFSLSTELPVAAGDRILFTCKEPERVQGIWSSLLYQVSIKSSDYVEYVAEELRAMLEMETIDEDGEA